MYKYVYIILVSVVIMSCQKPKKKLSISQYDPAAMNFSFLKEPLKDVRILALGESSHGFGTMHTMKSNLVKYLHNELGFDVLVMEAGYGDVGISSHNIDKMTPDQVMVATVNENLRSKQMLSLFQYIKEKSESENPLEYRGMDSRISGKAFNFRLMQIINGLETKVIQDSIKAGLLEYYKTFNELDNRAQWQKHMDKYHEALLFARSIVEDNREDILELELAEENEIEIMIKFLNSLSEASNYEFGEDYTRGLVLRDSLMAENTSYFIDEEFPNAKIIIWGHNGHIEKSAGEGDNIKWLGHYMKEKYGDKYYALGMYARKGFIYQSNKKKTTNFELKDPSFIEVKIDKDYGKNVFLDLPLYDESNTAWVNKPIFGYELEAGGKVNFIPSKRFDGVILLGETEAPYYATNDK